MVDLKSEFENEINTIIISGCVGPRGDGYRPENIMTVDEAQKYHSNRTNLIGHNKIKRHRNTAIHANSGNKINVSMGINATDNTMNGKK